MIGNFIELLFIEYTRRRFESDLHHESLERLSKTQNYMKHLAIGDKVKNKITGKTGIVTGESSYLYRASQLLVCYDDDKKEEWDEESVLELAD